MASNGGGGFSLPSSPSPGGEGSAGLGKKLGKKPLFWNGDRKRKRDPLGDDAANAEKSRPLGPDAPPAKAANALGAAAASRPRGPGVHPQKTNDTHAKSNCTTPNSQSLGAAVSADAGQPTSAQDVEKRTWGEKVATASKTITSAAGKLLYQYGWGMAVEREYVHFDDGTEVAQKGSEAAPAPLSPLKTNDNVRQPTTPTPTPTPTPTKAERRTARQKARAEAAGIARSAERRERRRTKAAASAPAREQREKKEREEREAEKQQERDEAAALLQFSHIARKEERELAKGGSAPSARCPGGDPSAAGAEGACTARESAQDVHNRTLRETLDMFVAPSKLKAAAAHLTSADIAALHALRRAMRGGLEGLLASCNGELTLEQHEKMQRKFLEDVFAAVPDKLKHLLNLSEAFRECVEGMMVFNYGTTDDLKRQTQAEKDAHNLSLRISACVEVMLKNVPRWMDRESSDSDEKSNIVCDTVTVMDACPHVFENANAGRSRKEAKEEYKRNIREAAEEMEIDVDEYYLIKGICMWLEIQRFFLKNGGTKVMPVLLCSSLGGEKLFATIGTSDPGQRAYVLHMLDVLAEGRETQAEAWLAYYADEADPEQLAYVLHMLDVLAEGRETQAKAWVAHHEGTADPVQLKYVNNQLAALAKGRETQWNGKSAEERKAKKADMMATHLHETGETDYDVRKKQVDTKRKKKMEELGGEKIVVYSPHCPCGEDGLPYKSHRLTISEHARMDHRGYYLRCTPCIESGRTSTPQMFYILKVFHEVKVKRAELASLGECHVENCNKRICKWHGKKKYCYVHFKGRN